VCPQILLRRLFPTYFPKFDTRELRGAEVLDLGCFTGGRAVYWVEKYGIRKPRGMDINPIFARTAMDFAENRGVEAEFLTAVGEKLPYPSGSLDFVVSYDVFEHVQCLQEVMDECWRVLKPGAQLLAVFPQFYQPLEAHLGAVSGMPGLHLLFSSSAITQAFNEIIAERGPDAYWYRREEPTLAPWEKLPTLNGITVAGFRRILARDHRWRIAHWSRRPIFSDGRKAKRPVFRVLRALASVPARLPLLEEVFLGRICVILSKETQG